VKRALIFDVDGTLSETEEVHRKAFNEAFKNRDLPWTWDDSVYRELLRVTGGKERIAHYIEQYDADDPGAADLDQWIREVHRDKTSIYTRMVAAGEAVLRPGIRRAIHNAGRDGYRLAIASTTTPANVDALLRAAFGSEGPALFEVICAGDMVANKKPAPDIYLLALDMLDLAPADCIAIEDSRNGLVSSVTAGIATVVTPSHFTNDQRFDEATLISNNLAEVDFSALFADIRDAAIPARDQLAEYSSR
jgi:HAD superfamily hydrolase (TIGR01509 family)